MLPAEFNPLKTRADQEIHPIARYAMKAYLSGGKLGFTEDHLKSVETRLSRLCALIPKDLPWALMSLLRFSQYLEFEQGDSKASSALFVACAVALPTMKEINQPIAEFAADLERRVRQATFRAMTDKKEVKTAPRYGADTPRGTVSLKDLRPRGKIR